MRLLVAVALAWHWSVTPTLAGGSSIFGLFGDYGTFSADQTDVADMVHAWNPNFIVTTGDNNYLLHEAPGTWDLVVGSFYGDFILGRSDNKYANQTSATQRFFPVVGNHDLFGPTQRGPRSESGFLDYFHLDPSVPAGRLPTGVFNDEYVFYEVRQGDAHFFMLDSPAILAPGVGTPKSDAALELQQQWLEAGLAESDAIWKFVVMHDPAVSSASGDVHAVLEWPFAAWGADAVFTGDSHFLERHEVAGIPHLISGAGGNVLHSPDQLATTSEALFAGVFGAVRVTFDAEQAIFELIAVDDQLPTGEVLDAWTLSGSLTGDFDVSGALDAADINQLSAAVRSGLHASQFDLTGEQLVDQFDRRKWVERLRKTNFGDADLDGHVTAARDGAALLEGLGMSGTLGWELGDFSGDGSVTAANDGAILLSNLSTSSDARGVPLPEAAGGLLLICIAMALYQVGAAAYRC